MLRTISGSQPRKDLGFYLLGSIFYAVVSWAITTPMLPLLNLKHEDLVVWGPYWFAFWAFISWWWPRIWLIIYAIFGVLLALDAAYDKTDDWATVIAFTFWCLPMALALPARMAMESVSGKSHRSRTI